MAVQKITPFLWFDSQAEEAANHYVSVFSAWSGAADGPSKILEVSRYPEGAPAPAGSVMTVLFMLGGQRFLALNGGPQFTFTEAVSFVVDCAAQEEVDELWAALSAGGEEGPCGWLKDRYGLSWQVVPTVLDELISDPDPAKSKATFDAMMTMKKLDIAALRKAHETAGS